MSRKFLALGLALSISLIILVEPALSRGGGHGGGRGHVGGRGYGGGHGFAGAAGRAGYDHHFDGLGRWGGYGDMYGARRAGAWGGWARPDHRFRYFGWGGWAEPGYAVAPGYGYMDYGGADAVDEQGSLYDANEYAMPVPATIGGGGYTWTSGSTGFKSPEEVKKTVKPPETVKTKSIYKLGPDADVVESGHVLFHLSKDDYLLVESDDTRVVDRASGEVIMRLATDPTLLYHVCSELKRQSLGLKAARLKKVSLGEAKKYELSTSAELLNDKSSEQQPIAKGEDKRLSDEQVKRDKLEIDNLEKSIALLEQALKNLGNVPTAPPDRQTSPDPQTIELFAGVWLTTDGKFVLYKQPNGSIRYIDGRGIYSDRGENALKEAYPDKFELAIYKYMKNLVDESQETMNRLKEDKVESQWAFDELDKQLAEGLRFDPGEEEDKRRLREEYSRRLIQASLRTAERIKSLDAQITSMPAEVEAARKAMEAFNK